MTRSVVIVGGGPRGVGVLERLAASAPELGVSATDPLAVHVVDPYPAGAGRIWRADQSALLWMNSMAADVTMFTDASVTMDGPAADGPSLLEWAQALRSGELDDEEPPGGPVGEEIRALGPATFGTRRLQSHYLAWTLRHVRATLPPGLTVHLHATRAEAAVGGPDDPTRRIRLADGTELEADAVVLASGHLDAAPTDDEQALLAEAARRGLRYLPPEQTTDSDLDVIPAGETVIARGMGLAFIDLMVLLFEGRGGRFVERGRPEFATGTGDGGQGGDGVDDLDYVPSGREVMLHVGSGHGVPYHAKTEYGLRGPHPPLPRFLGPDQVAALAARGDVELRRDVWPLMAKEIGWGHYHELVHGHPDRVTLDWDTFAARYVDLDWGSAGMDALVAEAVPDDADHLDFARLDRPLDGVRTDLETLQKHLRTYVADDLARHVDPAWTAELGAFVALLSVYAQVAELASGGALSARSRARDLTWWQNLFSSMASGPPGPRLRQLLALSRAGWVTFLGAGLEVGISDGAFTARSASLEGAPVRATTFVDARLSAPSVRRTSDPLLASLAETGVLDEEDLTWCEGEGEGEDGNRRRPGPGRPCADVASAPDAGAVTHATGLVPVRASDFRVLVGPDGDRPHPHLFAIGPHTTVRLPGAFTRPRTNALSLRANDAVARAVLEAVSG